MVVCTVSFSFSFPFFLNRESYTPIQSISYIALQSIRLDHPLNDFERCVLMCFGALGAGGGGALTRLVKCNPILF